ncbi:MAG TPA: sigma-54 dependent transcriptional regulator [Kofleriaceae bacterium]|nr:sigma-54 dependent transcriptional regulator [Kofleriaceae bacterium]
MARWSALVVDDDPGIRQSLRLCLEADDARVLGVGSAAAAIEALERSRFDVVLLDLWLGKDSGIAAIPDLLQRQPELAIIVITAFATFETAVEAMKRGATDYLPKPFTPEQVRAATRRALEGVTLRRRLADAERRLEQAGADDAVFESENAAFRQLLRQATKVAATDVPILLRGESGTGKDVLARWLWTHSARKTGPFVTADRGDPLARIQEAEGGTLLLDEIGDLSLDAQAALLRFLDDLAHERPEAKPAFADVRLIAATNRPIEEDVRLGRFREDLLFRLNVVTLALPPLRDRPEDLRALAHHFLARAASRQHRPAFELSDAADRAIRRYAWPGNLRELRNAIERAVILSPGPKIEVDDLGIPPALDEPGASAGDIALGAECSIDALEREHIARVVARSPTLEVAARVLGIDPSTLQRKRKRYGLS